MTESNVATRLKDFIASRDITVTQFADMCGIPRPTLSQLLTGRNKKLSDVIVGRIHDKFPEMSVLWLLFGEGDMLVPPPINPALMSEAEKFMEDAPIDSDDATLIELNQPQIALNSTENKAVNVRNAASSTHPNPAQSLPKPRRVKSITVFYDDDSYEVFIPEKKS